MKRDLNKAAGKPVTLSVRIQPRASKNELLEREGGGLKIRLTAPPVDGAANEALIRFLADRAGVSKSQVEIITGHASRDKVVRITGIAPENANRLLSGKGK
jgi:uncharacterized protein (TIGR00251 family)